MMSSFSDSFPMGFIPEVQRPGGNTIAFTATMFGLLRLPSTIDQAKDNRVRLRQSRDQCQTGSLNLLPRTTFDENSSVFEAFVCSEVVR